MGGMLVKWYKAYCLFVVISIITSCSLIAPMATSSTAAKQLSFVKTSVEVVSVYYTDKTATDHVVSIVLGKDCKMTRVAKREKICEEIKPKVYEYKNKKWTDYKLNNIKKIFIDDNKNIYINMCELIKDINKNKFNKNVIEINSGKAYLIGEGYSKEGQFPFIDEFNIKYHQSNISKAHALPMYSRSFNQVLRKKKFKPSDCLKIYQHIDCNETNLKMNVKDQDPPSLDDEDDELEFELSISEDEDEDEDEDEN